MLLRSQVPVNSNWGPGWELKILSTNPGKELIIEGTRSV